MPHPLLSHRPSTGITGITDITDVHGAASAADLGRRRFSAALLGAAALPWAAPAAVMAQEDLGAAPEFVGIDQWLNSPPLTIQGLAGKVTLVYFWTYSCINCINTLPHVVRWYDKYRAQGLVIVGVHTPEFAFEKSTANVQTALKRFDIRFPVAQDNSFSTWKAYRNQYWPAFYLADKTGRVRRKHFGEGRYQEMDDAIKVLLA